MLDSRSILQLKYPRIQHNELQRRKSSNYFNDIILFNEITFPLNECRVGCEVNKRRLEMGVQKSEVKKLHQRKHFTNANRESIIN